MTMKKTYPVVRGIQFVRADVNDPKAIVEQLQKDWHQFKAENDQRLKEISAKGHADPLLSEKVDKINAELTVLANLKDQLEKLETLVARGEFKGGGNAEMDKAKAEHAQAFEKFFRKGVDNGLADLEVKAALKTSSDPDGGYTVPEQMESAIDRVVATVSAMRRLASAMNISTDAYKKLVNQGGAGSGWVGEAGSRGETNTPSLKDIVINTKELYANPAATQTMLDDSAVNIEQWLADEVVIEFAEQEGDAFITGNGVEKPRGILGYTTVANANYAWGSIGYIATGGAATFGDPDKLIDLQHALKSTLRNGAVFLMADTTLAHCRKFKDGEGNYLWRPGLELDAPSTLLGKPVEIDDNMPAIAANAYPIAYANFKRAYLIVDRVGIRVLRDPYTNKPYVHFYTTKRVGGGVVMYEAIKLLKVAA
jgi:HK97 family phage major capsid protein